MKQFLKELALVKDLSSSFTEFEVLLVLCLSFSLALVIATIYCITHKGISYSQSFVHTMVIITVVVSLIMLIIGSNIARAFTLVGALSIVRFRNAVKETRDVGFIFLSMAIGMACGTRFYFLAAFSTLLISVFIYLLFKLNLFSKTDTEKLLVLRTGFCDHPEEVFHDILSTYLSNFSLVSLESSQDADTIELVYSIVLRRKASQAELLHALSQNNGNRKVIIVDGQQYLDI